MTENINQLLSKKEKIAELSDEAITDIYSRQIILKIAKNRKGYIKQDSSLFKALKVTEPQPSLYNELLTFDPQLFTRLDKKQGSIEDAIIEEFTNDIDHPDLSKIEVMRHKLEKTSECCGVPKAVLVHENIEGWYSTENN